MPEYLNARIHDQKAVILAEYCSTRGIIGNGEQSFKEKIICQVTY